VASSSVKLIVRTGKALLGSKSIERLGIKIYPSPARIMKQSRILKADNEVSLNEIMGFVGNCLQGDDKFTRLNPS
jgi:hypothetical protein